MITAAFVHATPILANGGVQVVSVAASPGIRAFSVKLAQRADLIRQGLVDPEVDNLLKVTSDGRKASIYNNSPGVWPECQTKLEACADRVWQHYIEADSHVGTQLVFCDLFTPKAPDMSELAYLESGGGTSGDASGDDIEALGIYGRLKTILVARGILPKEVVFAHDFKSAHDRGVLHEMIRSGAVRVCIGSTALIGIAINVQDRLIALHNLDCPWRPDELEQRIKRGQRQGNMWAQVHAYVYVTEGSYDPVVWQIVEGKARWISQLLSGRANRKSTEDIGTVVLTAALAKAIALGDVRVLDKTKLEIELTNLESRWLTWQAGRAALRRNLDTLPAEIERLQARAEYSARCLAVRTDETLGLLHTDGSLYTPTTYQEANLYVRTLWYKYVNSRKPVLVGHWYGFRLWLESRDQGDYVLVAIPASDVLNGRDGLAVSGVSFEAAMPVNTIGMALDRGELASTIRQVEKQITSLTEWLVSVRVQLVEKWPYQKDATTLLQRYTELCTSEPPLPDMMGFRFRFE